MTAIRNYNKIFGLLFGFIGCLFTWLVMSDASPIREYLSTNLISYWGLFHYPVFVVITLLNLPDVFTYPLIFVQWFLLGLLISRVLGKTKIISGNT